jgi:hypothetical protein
MAEGLTSELPEQSYCLEKENVRQSPHVLPEFLTPRRIY